MPPRRRKDSDADAAYDGVPTVNVVLDEEPPAMVGAVTPVELPVVEVPALDDDTAEAPQPGDED